jgi:predicted phosphoribosyltransferase
MESIRTAVAPRDWNGVRVVIIDDAAVAPWTLAAAAEAARLRGAAHIVVAVPFASVAVCDELTRHAHLVVAAVAPQHPVRSALEIYRAFPTSPSGR